MSGFSNSQSQEPDITQTVVIEERGITEENISLDDRTQPPLQKSFWDICKNPLNNPVTHYFKRTLPSSNPQDIEGICCLCWDECLKREGYQPKKAVETITPFVSTRGTESKPEANSL